MYRILGFSKNVVSLYPYPYTYPYPYCIKSLQAALPFVTKSKDTPSRKRPLLENRRPAVVMEPDKRKVHALVQHLQLIRSEKV